MVYLYLLKNKTPSGVREVQRRLGFSSPSVAFHHLEKLVELGIVSKNESGEYQVAKQVDSGILHAFLNVAGFTLPRLSFYAVFFSSISIAYLFLHLGVLDPLAILGTAGSSLCFWYETIRTWRRSPF